MDRRIPPAALTLAGMIATPLLSPRGRGRRVMSSMVVSGLAATTAMASARRWNAPRAGLGAGSIAVLTAAVERVGTRTGIPFGRYSYTGVLQPEVVGVPAIVPLAWFAMAVPARETAHAALGARSTPLGRIVLGAAALTAWDLFLDPQMVGEGYWTWARRGRYRGIPLSNYAGWFLTSLAVMGILERVLPSEVVAAGAAADAARDEGGALVAEYATMAAMETVGFAAFFGDRTVAAVGGAAMLSISVAAVRRRIRWPGR